MKKPRPETFAKIKGAVGARPVGSNAPPVVFQRDYAYAMPMIFKNATILTELGLDNEELHYKPASLKKEYMEALDTISQFYIRMYGECRADNIAGIAGWSEILEYLQGNDTDNENVKWARKEVFGLFNSFITLSLFVYMFSSKEMAVASPATIDSSCYNIETFLSILSVMDDEKRKDTLLEIRKFGLINPQVNFTALYNKGTEYLSEIKKDQEQRYGTSADSAEVG